MNTTERRRFTRFEESDGLDVWLRFVPSSEGPDLSHLGPKRGRILNISGGGGLVESLPIENVEGAHAILTIQLDSGKPALKLSVRVVGIRSRPSGLVGLGLMFLGREQLDVLPLGTHREKELERVSRYILEAHGLAKIPEVIGEMMRVVTSQRTSAHDLAIHIAKDEFLQEKILKIAQSPLFLTHGRIHDLDDAVRLLGFHSIRNIAVTVVSMRLFSGEMETMGETQAFWAHGIACANIAELLATRSGMQRDLIFSAGLLHDVGKLVLLCTFQSEYTELRRLLRTGDLMVSTLEKHLVCLPHADVNAMVAERLRFEPHLAIPLYGHHDTKPFVDNATAIIHLADLLCHEIRYTFPKGGQTPALNDSALPLLGLDSSDLTQLSGEAHRLIESMQIRQHLSLAAPLP
ncbi:MAG TPA: HDOD domain-containing protein [Dehalococcoidia bacterium]|nr:HDOD domain-containing protein [Dehalococcoidia bacterium]